MHPCGPPSPWSRTRTPSSAASCASVPHLQAGRERGDPGRAAPPAGVAPFGRRRSTWGRRSCARAGARLAASWRTRSCCASSRPPVESDTCASSTRTSFSTRSTRPRRATPGALVLDGALAGREPVGFAWTVLLAFLRLTTHPAVFPRPLAVGEATEIVRAWLAQPAPSWSTQRPGTPTCWRAAREAGTGANLVGDAHWRRLPWSTTPCWSPSTPTSGVSPGCDGDARNLRSPRRPDTSASPGRLSSTRAPVEAPGRRGSGGQAPGRGRSATASSRRRPPRREEDDVAG